MLTPDECLTELRSLEEIFRKSADFYANDPKYGTGKVHELFTRRADALKWVIEQNAWGVTPDEVTT